jgi:hypothetical protein
MNKHILLMALFLVPLSVFAQTQAAAVAGDGSGGRVLDGHLFLPSDIVEDPFTPTYFDESTGFGIASFRTNDVDNQGNSIGQTQFTLGALGQSFKLQVEVMDSWAVRLAASGTVLSGINADSALIAGATVGYSLSTGVTYSFMLGKVRMAGAFDLEFAPLYTFSPLTALVNTISTAKIDTGTLFTSSQDIRLRPALLAAMALDPSLGLRGVIDFEEDINKSGGASTNTGSIDVGAAVDVDLRSLTTLPLGLLAGYKLTVPTTGDGWGHQVTLGLFYTAQRNLGLGIQTVLQLPTAPAGISDYYVLLASLTLRYYWS